MAAAPSYNLTIEGTFSLPIFICLQFYVIHLQSVKETPRALAASMYVRYMAPTQKIVWSTARTSACHVRARNRQTPNRPILGSASPTEIPAEQSVEWFFLGCDVYGFSAKSRHCNSCASLLPTIRKLHWETNILGGSQLDKLLKRRCLFFIFSVVITT